MPRKRTVKPFHAAHDHDNNNSKGHKKELERKCKESIISLQLFPEEYLAEAESFKGVDWLKEVTTIWAGLPNVNYAEQKYRKPHGPQRLSVESTDICITTTFIKSRTWMTPFSWIWWIWSNQSQECRIPEIGSRKCPESAGL
jgi:hypothetical protein